VLVKNSNFSCNKSYSVVTPPQTVVEVEDFMKAQPDAIAHSAAKIISRLKAGGEKTIQALKSLCWRCKGIQVEVTYKKLVNCAPGSFICGQTICASTCMYLALSSR
jgi:hypothetical protein